MIRRVLPVLLLAACASDDIVIGALHEVTSMPAVPNRDLDVLFVIDDSPGMSSKQVALDASMARLIDRLTQIDGGLPDLQIGVTTTDMGTSSASGPPAPSIGAVGQGGCFGAGRDGALITSGLQEAAPFLFDRQDPGNPDRRVRNYTGNLADEVATMTNVGGTGCGFEQPLAAMRRALTNPEAPRLVRDGANLVVVFVGDEDDCSAARPELFAADPKLGPPTSYRCFARGVMCDEGTDQPGAKHSCRPDDASQDLEPIGAFRDALLALKPDPGQIMLAALTGDATPVTTARSPAGGPELELAASCRFDGAYGPDEAYPAIRLDALIDGMPGPHVRQSICHADDAAPLDAIGAAIKQMIGDPCISSDGLVDATSSAGPACEVTVDTGGGQAVMSSCKVAGAESCFSIVPDAQACPDSPDHLRLSVRLTTPPPAGAKLHVKCQIAD